jgi:hypothetical protein
MALTDSILNRKVLGNRVGRSKVLGVKTVSDQFLINKEELEDLQQIHGAIALRELEAEQRNGSLANHNTFVDGSQFRQVKDVSFGGVISFEDVFDLAEVMIFIQLTMRKVAPVDTGAMRDTFIWMLNGTPTTKTEVPVVNGNDRLVYTSTVPYAKFVEVGAGGSTRQRKNRFFVRKAARRAQQKFGKAFIIKPVLLQASEVPASVAKKRSLGGAFSKQYYIERWKVSYPAIQITQRQGVSFQVRG